jgi:hypothetical protein
MKINAKQAQLLLDWMAMAATDAAEDEREGTAWRIHRFQHQSKMLMEQFNEVAEEKEE